VQIGHQEQIDDVVGFVRSVDEQRTSQRTQGHEIGVRYGNLSSVRQMNGERLKRLQVALSTNSFDSHLVTPLSHAYPTEPSICSSIRRFISTAYSMGSSRTSGSIKPLTIIVLASASLSPRLVR